MMTFSLACEGHDICDVLSTAAPAVVMPAIPQQLLMELFPCHIILNSDGNVQQVGPVLSRLFSNLIPAQAQHIGDVLQVLSPANLIDWDIEQLSLMSPCWLESLVARDRDGPVIKLKGSWVRSQAALNQHAQQHPQQQQAAAAAGTVPAAWLFIGQVVVQGLDDLTAAGLQLCDLSSFDLSADYCMLHERHKEDVANLSDQISQLEEKLRHMQEGQAQLQPGTCQLHKLESSQKHQSANLVRASLSASNNCINECHSSQGLLQALGTRHHPDVEQNLMEMITGRHLGPAQYPLEDLGIVEREESFEDYLAKLSRSATDRQQIDVAPPNFRELDNASRLSTIHSQIDFGQQDSSQLATCTNPVLGKDPLAAGSERSVSISQVILTPHGSASDLRPAQLRPLAGGLATNLHGLARIASSRLCATSGDGADGEQLSEVATATSNHVSVRTSMIFTNGHQPAPGPPVFKRNSIWRWFSCLIGGPSDVNETTELPHVANDTARIIGQPNGKEQLQLFKMPHSEAAVGAATAERGVASFAVSNRSTSVPAPSPEPGDGAAEEPVRATCTYRSLAQQPSRGMSEAKIKAQDVRWQLNLFSTSSSRESRTSVFMIQEKVAVVLKPLPDKVMQVLANIDAWAFDSFQLAEVTDNKPLSTLAFALLKRSGIVTCLQLDEAKLARFLVCIEDGYLDNPYHSRTHAADVLRTLYAITTRGGLMYIMSAQHRRTRGSESGPQSSASSQSLPLPRQHQPESGSCTGAAAAAVAGTVVAGLKQQRQLSTQDALTLLAVYLAAIIHDYDHRGLTNAFLIQDQDLLAIRYNDLSPMENHHVAAAFAVALEEPNDFMGHLPRKVRDVFRLHVIQMVLGTDMKQHFDTCGQFKGKMAAVAEAHAAEGTTSSRLSTTGIVTTGPASGAKRQLNGRPTVSPHGVLRAAHSCLNMNEINCQSRIKGSLSGGNLGPAAKKLVASTDMASRLDSALFPAAPMGTCSSASMASRKSFELPTPPTSAGSSAYKTNETLAKKKLCLADVNIDDELNMLVWKMALKCADLGHLASVEDVHRKWVHLLEEEMFQQGDTEKERGHPVSPLMDRCKAGITKSQPGFFDAIVLPLFVSFTDAVPTLEPLLRQVMKNHAMWVREERAAVADKPDMVADL